MLPAGESYDGSLQVVPGLGLVSGCVVGVHFSEWNTLPDVFEVVVRTYTATGWGIDEPACAVFGDGQCT